MIKIIEKLTSNQHSEYISNVLNSDYFPWFLGAPGEIYHCFYKYPTGINSGSYDDVVRLLDFMKDKIKINTQLLINVKARKRFLSIDETPDVNFAHIKNYKTLIFCLDDSPGTVTFYKEKYFYEMPNKYDPTKLTVDQEIKAEKGLAIYFNGNNYYKNDFKECVILDFKIKDDKNN